jgi:hypothetical protein
MIDTHEPKNGDFVAYIEQLQKESAARLLGSGHHVITQLEKKPASSANKDGSHFFAGRKPADLRSAAQLHATASQIAAAPSMHHIISSVVAILFGAAFGLYWLIASTSFVPLLIAAGLIVWGVGRFRRALELLSPGQNKNPQALVASVFTPPPTKLK